MGTWLEVPGRTQIWMDRVVGRRPTLWRWVLAGPLAFVLSILAMAGLPTVLPAGAGGVNHLVLPVALFPLLWASFVVWPVATDQMGHVVCIYLGLLVLFIALITLGFLT